MYRVTFYVAGTSLSRRIVTYASSTEWLHVGMATFVADVLDRRWALAPGQCVEWSVEAAS